MMPAGPKGANAAGTPYQGSSDFREHGYLVASLADYGAWPPGYRRGRSQWTK
jgi:hypothetical protein